MNSSAEAPVTRIAVIGDQRLRDPERSPRTTYSNVAQQDPKQSSINLHGRWTVRLDR